MRTGIIDELLVIYQFFTFFEIDAHLLFTDIADNFELFRVIYLMILICVFVLTYRPAL